MTPNYQRRARTATALQFNGGNLAEIIALLGGINAQPLDGHILVRWGSAISTIHNGDWVLIGEDGKARVYKPDQFELMYEPIPANRIAELESALEAADREHTAEDYIMGCM